MGVASLVLGILSIIVSFAGIGVQWIGCIFGLLGIIFGANGRKDPEKRGISTGGLVCSIIGFILSAIFYIGCAAAIGGLSAMS